MTGLSEYLAYNARTNPSRKRYVSQMRREWSHLWPRLRTLWDQSEGTERMSAADIVRRRREGFWEALIATIYTLDARNMRRNRRRHEELQRELEGAMRAMNRPFVWRFVGTSRGRWSSGRYAK